MSDGSEVELSYDSRPMATPPVRAVTDTTGRTDEA